MWVVMNATAQAPAPSASGPKLDNRRVLAGLVDMVIVAIGAVVVLVAGGAMAGENSDVQGSLRFVLLGWALYYYFALESGDGQTVGKKLMKLRVVRADGGPAGMREIAVRTVLRVVDGIGAYMVGLITMLVTGEKRQRIGDLAAGTMVVDAKTPTSAPASVAAPVATEDVDEEDADGDDAGKSAEPAAEAVEPATITLPPRAAAPTTLSDLSAPDAEQPAVPAMRPFPDVGEPASDDAPAEDAPVADALAEDAPVEDAPVEEAPVVDAPVADDHSGEGAEVIELAPVEQEDSGQDATVIEFAPPAGDEPPAAEADELPEITSPSLEALARDVAAAHSEPELEVVDPEPAAPEAAAPEAEAADAADAQPEADQPAADAPVSIRSVETVSAIDLVMGGASEDEDPSDDPPASA